MNKARLCGLAYYVFVFLVILLILKNGLLLQVAFPLDSFVIVSSAWKIVNGQIPYTDFFVIYGPGHFFLLSVIMEWTHFSPEALPLSFAIPLIPLSIVIWQVLIVRYSPYISLTIASYLVMVWGSSMPLHFFFFESSYAMFENREAYVLVCIIFILLLPVKHLTRTSSTYFLFGVLLGIIIFLKINYFAATCAVAVFILNRALLSRSTLAVAPGFAFGALPFIAGLRGFPILPMISDLKTLAALRAPGLYEDAIAIALIEMSVGTVFLFEIYRRQPEAGNQFSILRAIITSFNVKRLQTYSSFLSSVKSTILSLSEMLIVECSLMVLMTGFLEFGSFPEAHLLESPLLACYTIILFSRLADLKSGRFNLATSIIFLFGLSYLNLFAGLLFPMFVNTVYAPSVIKKINSASYPIPIFAYRDEKVAYFDWPSLINDGLGLITKHGELKGKRIAPLGLTDYFSYSLLNPPPRHLPAWMSFGNDLSDKVYFPPDYIFSDADAILVPIKPETKIDMYGRIAAYRDYINLHYKQVDQSDKWMLWEHKVND